MTIKWIVFIICFIAGVGMIKYCEPLVRTFGKSVFAEKYLGMGGSYNMWKLIGVVVMAAGFLYLLGTFDVAGWGGTPLEQTTTNFD